jgi:hypothetical protein
MRGFEKIINSLQHVHMAMNKKVYVTKIIDFRFLKTTVKATKIIRLRLKSYLKLTNMVASVYMGAIRSDNNSR